MIVVRILLSITILLNLILTFFSFMLLLNLLQGKNNFLFNVAISNLAENSDYFKAGTGIIVGSSIFLSILLIILGVHYQTSFDTDLKGIQRESDKMADYHTYKTIGGKSVEMLIGILIVFMAIGTGLYSIDWFSNLYNNKISTDDAVYCWTIFGLGVSIIILSSVLMLFFLVKKPSEKGKYMENKDNFCNFSTNFLLSKFSDLRNLTNSQLKVNNTNWYSYIYSKLMQYEECNKEEKSKLATLLAKKYSVNDVKDLNNFLKTLENNYLNSRLSNLQKSRNIFKKSY